METSATQNQKVFVTLRGFTELVNEYNRVKQEVERTSKLNAISTTFKSRKETLEYVFKTLELPVPLS